MRRGIPRYRFTSPRRAQLPAEETYVLDQIVLDQIAALLAQGARPVAAGQVFPRGHRGMQPTF
jgi:hypothetical protein